LKKRLRTLFIPSEYVTIDISAHDKNSFTGKSEKEVPKSTTIIRKKREDIEKSVRESEEKAGEKPSDSWYRHWESEGEDAPDKPKKLGGNRRPKPFNYSNDKDDKDN
jgi:hypothetical protein